LFNYGLDFGAVVHSRRVLESVTPTLSFLAHLANRYYWFARNPQASIGLENTSVTIGIISSALHLEVGNCEILLVRSDYEDAHREKYT
jgi:hypothetical protein